ncbi:MAG TPA: hypothetical protein PLP33_24685 [Leptospiraceae bacterium]|nr:hypothetical protein [Leptospiraceae bacterium]
MTENEMAGLFVDYFVTGGESPYSGNNEAMRRQRLADAGLLTESVGAGINFEIPAKAEQHAKVNPKHQREILLSIRLVADAELVDYLRSLPLSGPNWYAEWKFGRNERLCVQHPHEIRAGVWIRVRLTRECYRSNFFETRLTFEPLSKAVPDSAKWEKIPTAESWAEVRGLLAEKVGEVPNLPKLYRYEDASEIRPATAEEYYFSVRAMKNDSGAGVITVDIDGESVSCYVL